MMNKKLIKKIETASINTFTTDFGLKIRRKTHKLLSFCFRLILKYIYHHNIIVSEKPHLDKDKNYIFASNHTFFFDGASVIATNDRNCYSLFGATEQLYFDFHTFFIWLSGLIYVDRFNKQSRKDSVDKMNRVLQAGNSILIFPEGRWNDTESRLCQKLFAGAYNLSVQNNIEVVPVSVYNETSKKNIYISYGEPLKLYNYDKDKALQILRDNIATMCYEQIEKYSTPLDRSKVKKDLHFDFMDERMFEYSKANWRSDYCWDDELFEYKSGDVDLEDVWKDIDKVNINSKNANIFGDILVELEKRKKYNFKDYMNENYRKKY